MWVFKEVTTMKHPLDFLFWCHLCSRVFTVPLEFQAPELNI
jgi:hypothetical protein